MFATVHNTHLSQFMSPIPEPLALEVDALFHDWQRSSMYMFPPFPLLNKVIQKLCAIQEAEVILIAPWWPTQPWFPHLLRLCVDHSLFFPYHRDLLSQQEKRFTSDEKSYHLHSWRLSCNITKQQGFQIRSLGLPLHLGDPRPIPCMTAGGFASLTRRQGKDLIRLVPQLLKYPPFVLTF